MLMNGPLATSASSLYILYTLHFVDHALNNSRTLALAALALFSVVILATYAQTDGAHNFENAFYGLHSRPLPSL
jgi:hypothetical protein